MGQNMPLKIVVLGAGPSGLCAAWNLVKDGHQVIVIEKESVCGGLSKTFQQGNYKYDLGPHNIHSQRKSTINFLKKNLGENFVKRKFWANIYFRGKRINYPFWGADVLRSISLFTAANCGISFLWSRFITFFAPKFKDDGSYETWIVNRFGRKFYNIFFAPYSEKVWKISPKEISDIVAKKRIPVSGILEIIHSIISKQQRFHPENPRLIDNFYHLHGVGKISDFFVREILEGKGKIITEATVKKIVVDQCKVKQIHYSHKNKNKCIDFEKEKSEGKVLSTIPVNEMVMMLGGNIPETVILAAKGLDFTSEVLLYLNLNKRDVFNIPLFYFSEWEFPFNRIYDVGIFSREMVPAGKNAICLEISCNRGDEIWRMDDEALFEKCISPLEKYHLLHRTEVEYYHTRRIEHAYPRFRLGYRENLKIIFKYLDQLQNLMSFGRQGLFAYANVDDAIWMGFEVAKNIRYQDRMRLSAEELLPSYISY